MKPLVNQNIPYTTTSLSKLSSFHTKTQWVQRLRDVSEDLKSVSSAHSNVLKFGFLNDTFTVNHLINAYLRFGKTNDARRLFDKMSEPNVVSWTSLMAGYINARQPNTALHLFAAMLLQSPALPNTFTFATAINACSALSVLDTGRTIHARVQALGFQSDLVVSTSLIDMYSKCNNVDESRRVFDTMPSRNLISWGSMIAAYAQNAQGHDALQLFGEFNRSNLDRPNHFMLASVANACASLGKLVTGKATHAAVIRRGHDANKVVAGALVDMYGKCGCVVYCEKVFRRIRDPCVIPYTSMIVGAAKYGGFGTSSLDIFEEMVSRGVRPNGVTFLGVLHACSHSGLVDRGLEYLNSMYRRHRITPEAKHYTCAVDMLGRAGRLDEAYDLAKSIKVRSEDGELLWVTLLSASRTYRRLDLAVEASERLLELNRGVAGAYVTMSNTYASAGEWDNVGKIRSDMKRNRVYKEPGCSWVEIKDATYVFYAGDMWSCPRASEVMSLLGELEMRLRERGHHVGGNEGLVFVAVGEETKGEIVEAAQ